MGNVAVITGRLGKDPEMVPYGDGKNLCKFSMATDDGWGENKKTNWHRITVFGKTAELCNQYLSKGRMCQVVGRIDYDSYEKDGIKRYTTDIIADSVEFLGGKGDSAEQKGPQIYEVGAVPEDDDSDLPF